MVSFFITVVFGKIRPLASSKQRSNRRHTVQRSKGLVTMDINPSLQILGCYVKEQVFDKGIRQKSTKRVNSLIVCSAICPGPPNRDPHGLRETIACIHVSRNYGAPRVACWQVFRQNSQKSECVLRRSPLGGTKHFAWLDVLRREMVNKWRDRFVSLTVFVRFCCDRLNWCNGWK